MKPLLILAGGFGTRLKSVISDVPKPLAPIGDSPFLKLLIENWMSQGIREMYFLIHYEADQIISFLESINKKSKFKCVKFHFCIEDVPLGTGGAILNAINFFGLNESFLVSNADSWLGGGIKELEGANYPAIGAVKVLDPRRYGILKIKQNRVIYFCEKDISVEKHPSYINSGLYHLHPENFKNYHLGHSFSLETDFFPELIKEGCYLKAVKLNDSFIDIGVPSDYFEFIKRYKK